MGFDTFIDVEPLMIEGDLPRIPYDAVEFEDEFAVFAGAPVTGIIYQTFPDGRPLSEGRYRDGLPEGTQREWYSNGQLRLEWIAVRGHGSSKASEWYEHGQLKSVRHLSFGRLRQVQEWDEIGRMIRDEEIELDDRTMSFIERMESRLPKE
jgi:hypothetical protein